MLKITKYRGNKAVIIKLIEELKDYLTQIDPRKRLRRLPEYGKIYTNDLLKKINKNHGVIYIAELDDMAVGLIAGIMENWTKLDEVASIPAKPARILELVVSEKHRGKNIGTLLMNKIEGYFKTNGCDVFYVDVFAPNQKTHKFYRKLGYHDDLITMEKIIS